MPCVYRCAHRTGVVTGRLGTEATSAVKGLYLRYPKNAGARTNGDPGRNPDRRYPTDARASD
jgi:hypothetical protein